MKKYMATFVATLMAAGLVTAAENSAGNPSLKEGTKELRLSGHYDPDAFDNYDWELQGGYGVFVIDNLELGAAADLSATDHTKLYGLSAFAEYNLDLGSPLVPYGRISAGWLGGSFKNPLTHKKDDDNAAAGALALGAKYFITETVALALEGEYTKASEDLFVNDKDELKDNDFGINISLRFFIP